MTFVVANFHTVGPMYTIFCTRLFLHLLVQQHRSTGKKKTQSGVKTTIPSLHCSLLKNFGCLKNCILKRLNLQLNILHYEYNQGQHIEIFSIHLCQRLAVAIGKLQLLAPNLFQSTLLQHLLFIYCVAFAIKKVDFPPNTAPHRGLPLCRSGGGA